MTSVDKKQNNSTWTKVKAFNNKFEKDQKQIIGAIFVLVLFISLLIARSLTGTSDQRMSLPFYILQGFMFGYILQRSFFGFAGGFVKPIRKRDYSLSKNIILFLAISTIAITFCQVLLEQNGVSILVVGHSVSFMFVIGGLLFGMGMVLAGGCASGTLQDAGDGFTTAMLAIIGWIFGTFVGFIFLAPMSASSWMSNGFNFNFMQEWGLLQGLMFNLFLLGIIGFILIALERKFLPTKVDYNQELENDIKIQKQEYHPSFIKEQHSYLRDSYFNIFVKKWNLKVGAVLLAFIAVYAMVGQGGWGISTAYGMWGAWILEGFGVDIMGIHLAGEQIAINQQTLEAGFWNHGGSIQNISIIGGALFYNLTANRFKLKLTGGWLQAITFIFGGFIMGVGTRLAGGCNIGALAAPIISGSIAGYFFGMLLLIGAWVIIKSQMLVKKKE